MPKPLRKALGNFVYAYGEPLRLTVLMVDEGDYLEVEISKENLLNMVAEGCQIWRSVAREKKL